LFSEKRNSTKNITNSIETSIIESTEIYDDENNQIFIGAEVSFSVDPNYLSQLEDSETNQALEAFSALHQGNNKNIYIAENKDIPKTLDSQQEEWSLSSSDQDSLDFEVSSDDESSKSHDSNLYYYVSSSDEEENDDATKKPTKTPKNSSVVSFATGNFLTK